MSDIKVNKETVYKGCSFAISALIEKGSVAFTFKDKDGNRQFVEWFDLLDALSELCEIREEN